MKIYIKLIIIIALCCIITMFLGIYGKFIFCFFVFLISLIYGIIKDKYYTDILGNIYFQEFSSKREKYLDNKALSEMSILYRTINIPFSKKDFIIYNYQIGERFIDDFSNDCEVLMYGAQNGWNEYKENLIKELQKNSNKNCINNLNNILLNNDIDSNKDKFIKFLK